jgi:antitoxin (DNA-binding transcriptional repressor) of toxin-antitoxin stability system
LTEFLAQTQSLSRAAESRRRFGSAGGAFGAGLPKTGFGLHGCRGRLAPDGHSPDVQMARLLLQTLTLPLAVEFAAAPDPASVTVDAAAAPLIEDFFKFWQASVGSGHAALGVPGAIPAGDIPVGPGGSLGQMWQEQLKAVHDDCGIDGVRFHGSFDDDMGPVATGCDPITGRQCTWNFTGLDVLYDGILAAGVKVTIAQNTRPLAQLPLVANTPARLTSPTALAGCSPSSSSASCRPPSPTARPATAQRACTTAAWRRTRRVTRRGATSSAPSQPTSSSGCVATPLRL